MRTPRAPASLLGSATIALALVPTLLAGAAGADPLPATATWSVTGGQAGAQLGFSVASAGDVDRDGYDDVIVGALYYDDGENSEGRATLYYGGPQGPATVAGWSAESDSTGALFGAAVASAGDVNGDGYADVVVGARGLGDGQASEGAVFVYLGAAGGLGKVAAWTAMSDEENAQLGGAVASAGDVNGDGYDDVIAGAKYAKRGLENEGAAFLWLGSANGLGAKPAWTADGADVDGFFGESVASAGDVNGDGYDDVLVGAPHEEYTTGTASLYLGSAQGLAALPAWVGAADGWDTDYGASVAGIGDIDGDGYDDVAVGAPKHGVGLDDEGRVLVYRGSAGGIVAPAAWILDGGQAGAQLGTAVAPAGDVDGDGHADLLVGAQYLDDGQEDEGAAYLYLGGAGGLAAAPAWTATSDQEKAYLGHCSAPAGDVNGDGAPDVIVGARYFEAVAGVDATEGAAFVWLGNAPPPPGDTGGPGDTDEPADTDEPGDTDTDVPGDTDEPGDTDVPGDTDEPGDTDVPGDTDTDVPGDTDTDVPGDTDVPADTDVAEPGGSGGGHGCDATGGASPGWLALAGLALLARRRAGRR